MIGLLGRLHRDEGAQGAAFAAITLFVLAAFLAFVLDVGTVLEARTRLQGAADAAAFSGAVVRAQGLAAIAAMNHTLVWLARAAAALVASTVSLGVLVALNAVFPGAFAWAVPLFSKSLEASVTWLPRLRSWSERIARAEDRLARLAPALAAGEAERIARANGAAHAIPFPPAAPLPVSPETVPARFAARVLGAALPGWALGPLTGGSLGGFSRSHSGTRDGQDRSATKGSEDLGDGVSNPADRGKLGRFRELLQQYGKSPWPMPRVLDRRFASESFTALALAKDGAYRAPLLPGTFRTPRRWPMAATARPFHPGLPPSGAEASGDNLYLIEGWSAELVPVDLRALRALEKAGGPDLGTGKAKGRPAWLQH